MKVRKAYLDRRAEELKKVHHGAFIDECLALAAGRRSFRKRKTAKFVRRGP